MFDQTLRSGGGIPSVCSAHPVVLREALRSAAGRSLLIESTCNQVNQFGGYTGMTPADFAAFLRGLAQEVGAAPGQVLLGGDHLGPNVWQSEPAESAMSKSVELVQAYVRAGYTKLHLDCSMTLGGDPPGRLAPELAARRAARLAQAAEEAADGCGSPGAVRYVIGTDVPVPGGAQAHEDSVEVTRPAEVAETLATHRQAFLDLGLRSAWERVVAVVVQPGVEFGDDFVLPYRPEATRELTAFIRSQGLVYEAHSTDYQTPAALRELVRDRFAILKVGPALTFAYREAVFALAWIENECVPAERRSNLLAVLEETMLRQPGDWQKYYRGSPTEQAFQRKYSLSDRIRYYWARPEVQRSLRRLMENLPSLPFALASQFVPRELAVLQEQGLPLTPQAIIAARVGFVLDGYWSACE